MQAVGVKLSPLSRPCRGPCSLGQKGLPLSHPREVEEVHRAEFIPNPTSFLLGHPKEVTEPLWASVISKSGNNEVFLEGWLRGSKKRGAQDLGTG